MDIKTYRPLGRQQELPVQVADDLRRLIISEDMKAGDRFPSESELVKMFAVGRSTVREAVKLLVAENIVEIRRGTGTFITQSPGMTNDPLGLTFANQREILTHLLETRMIIEPRVAFLAAKRATEEDIASLGLVLEKLRNPEGRPVNHAVLDMEFHTIVAECSQNEVLQRVIPIINESITTGHYETIDVEGSQQRAMKCHIEIYNAIKNGDAVMAQRATEAHIRQTANDAKIQLEDFNYEKTH